MKSEERHQLLTNDLGVVTERTVGFFERHLETAIAVVCGLVVAVGIGYWWTSSSGTDNEAAWTLLDSGRTLQDFGTVAERYKGKPAGQWAELKIAEKSIEDSLPLMFTNRELALAGLKSARTAFETLIQDKSASSLIHERSLWGLALCLEATCEGDTSKPIEALERLVTDYPDTIFKNVANEKIAGLKRKDAAEFYTWFSKEDPKPREARPDDNLKAGDITLPGPGGFTDAELDDPVLKGPGTASPIKNEETSKPDAPKQDGPKVESKEAESAKPADATDASPAEPAKPVTEDKSTEKK